MGQAQWDYGVYGEPPLDDLEEQGYYSGPGRVWGVAVVARIVRPLSATAPVLTLTRGMWRVSPAPGGG